MANPNSATNTNTIPFEAVASTSYVAKIKYLILGTTVNDEEVAQGASDDGLKALVHLWLQDPKAQDALYDFFQVGFQQQAVVFNSHITPFGNGPPNNVLQQIRDSFTRTAMYMVQQGRPLTDLYTTHEFMMTTEMMVTMLVGDTVQVRDDGNRYDLLTDANPNFSWRYTTEGPSIAAARSANPADPDYMVWYAPVIMADTNVCKWSGVVTDDLSVTNQYVAADLWNFFLGTSWGFHDNYCTYYANNAQFVDADTQDWRMVKLVTVDHVTAMTNFYDLPGIRKATTMNVMTPRVGFFSTQAFFSQYLSNSGNSARGVANQTMIVGIGKPFDGSDQTQPASLAALDAVHAPTTSPCHSCHLTMDPMRQYFRQQYTHAFRIQDDPNEVAMPGIWAVNGQTAVGTGIDDFANRLAQHPNVAITWTLRVCSWLNNVNCVPEDPEVVRIAANFKANNLNFMSMLEEMITSPITTGKSVTVTASQMGVVATVARRQDFCRSMSHRFDTFDICALRYDTSNGSYLNQLATPSTALSDVTYSRGLPQLIIVPRPNVMTRTAMETICGVFANQFIDNDGSNLWSSSDPNAAIASVVKDFIGVGGQDPQPFVDILTRHYNDALNLGLSPQRALQSTFVVACLSPKVSLTGL